jgi:acetoin utilization deacetylase AcuC-like enzyme
MALRAAGLGSASPSSTGTCITATGRRPIFDADPDLCYASTHQSPLYPGTGSAEERGTGPGEGTKHNVPLPPGSGDAEFVTAWEGTLLPAVEAFGPEAILVSAGYDAHRDDPLAELEVTAAGYGSVAETAGRLAHRAGLKGVALTLEGGYDLDALRESAGATVAGLLAGLSGRRLAEAILDLDPGDEEGAWHEQQVPPPRRPSRGTVPR